MKSTQNILRVCGVAVLVCAALLVTSSPSAVSEPLVKAQAIGHISNGSGNVETDVSKLTIGGLTGRFSQEEIRPGDREVIAIVLGVCDAGVIANTAVTVLPDIVSGTPTIAGGLAALPCIALGGGDGLHTGINGAVLTFTGPLAQHMGTVRMYADLNFNGRLFEGGDLIGQQVPILQGNGEVIAQFGRGQGQMLSTSSGAPLVAPDFPSWFALGAPFVAGGQSFPIIILFTVDISSTAPGGRVEVAVGLQVGDDTAMGPAGFCVDPGVFPPFGPIPLVGQFNCGSNIRGAGPATHFFDVVGSGGGAIPPGGPPPPPPPPGGGGGGGSGGSTLASYDFDGDCSLGNSEFFSLVDAWLGESVTDSTFFAGIDAWVSESNICTAASAGMTNKSERLNADVSMNAQSVTFHMDSQSVASTAVEVFSLNGTRVFAGESQGARLTWQLNSGGKSVANGVYFYHLISKDLDGNVLRSELRRIAIVR